MIKAKILLIFITSCLLLATSAQSSVVDSLENLLQKHVNEDTLRVILLNNTAYAFWSINPKKMLEYAKEAEKLSNTLKFSKGKTNSLRKLAVYYWTQSDYPKSIEYYKESLNICKETNDKKGMASSYYGIGMISRLEGNYQAALENYKKSLEIKIEFGDKKAISTDYLAIGMIYANQGDYFKALEYYQKSLKIKEEINDKAGISHILYNIGSIHGTQEEYRKALGYYQRSLKIKEELGDKNGRSYCLNSIGILLRNQGNYTEALENSIKALEIREELGDRKAIANSYYNIAEIYNATGDYEKAFGYYQKSLELSIEIGHKKQESKNYIGLGSLYFRQNDAQKAYEYSKKAYDIAEKIGDAELIKASSEILAKSSGILGFYKVAYNYHVIFKTMNDTLYNANNVKKIVGLEYQYKYEKEKQATELEQQKKDAIKAEEMQQQKLIRNLFIIGFIVFGFFIFVIYKFYLQTKKTNSKLTTQNKVILKQKEEKEILLKEIHHRVKNNLQIISSLLNLQTKKIEDKEMLSAMSDGQSRVKAMALIHQKLYENDDISSINFIDYTSQLLNQTAGLYPELSNVVRKVVANDIELDIDTAVPLGLILSELITNAYKYAFKNKEGAITISLGQKEHNYILKVHDSGSGLPHDFDLSTTTSIGLRLVRRLSRQLYGNSSYEYKNGACFIITFKDSLGRKETA